MQLQQFNDLFTATLDLAAGLLVPSAISYGGGLLYGTLLKTDKILAARAFTISTIVYYAFQALAHFATEGEEARPKTFYATQIVGTDTLGVIQILAYRKLNLIALPGTVAISAFMSLGSLIYLGKIIYAYSYAER